MTWKDRAAIGVLLAALAAVSLAMLVPPPPEPARPVVVSSVQPAYVEGIVGRPNSINPLTVRTQVDRDIVALIFRGLMRQGPAGELLPDLAESWARSDDGLSWTFALRRDAYWHDGLLVTARDVAFTIAILKDPAYQGALGVSWRGIDVTADGLYVVRFKLTRPIAGFLQMATLGLVPEHVLSGIPVAQLADSPFSQHPLGSGPFQLIDLDSRHARLQRVRHIQPAPGQFTAPSATPALPSEIGMPIQYDTLSDIELRFFDRPALLLSDFEAGHLTAAGGLSPADVTVGLRRGGAKAIDYPLSTMTAVVLNLRPTHAYLQDASVRAGLLGAIDRDALVKDELSGRGSRADIPIPSSSPAYDPSAVTAIAFDRDAAAAKLEKGGWKRDDNGGWAVASTEKAVSMTVLTPDAASNGRAFATAQRVVAQWQAIGLDVKLSALPSADYIAALRASNFDAAVVDIDLGLDPDLWPLLYSTEAVTGGTNISGYQDGDLDKLLTTARTALDQDARRKALSALEAYLSAENPILPLYFSSYTFLVAGLENISRQQIADPSGRYWDVIDWRLASDG